MDHLKSLKLYYKFVSLHNLGWSFAKIANKYGMTKQGVHIKIKRGEPCEKRVVNGIQSKLFLASGYLPSGRERTRMLVRIRDNFTCQDCGAIRNPIDNKSTRKRLFDVHHLNGLCGKMSRSYDKVESIDNLITLCHKCHFNRPEHTVKLKK